MDTEFPAIGRQPRRQERVKLDDYKLRKFKKKAKRINYLLTGEQKE